MRATEILRAIFQPSGPRRDDADAIARELDRERRINRVSTWRNSRAVKALLEETVARVEHTNGTGGTHR